MSRWTLKAHLHIHRQYTPHSLSQADGSLTDMTGIWVHVSWERNKGTNDHVYIPFREIPTMYFEDTFIKEKTVRWKQKSSGKIKLLEGLCSTQIHVKPQ